MGNATGSKRLHGFRTYSVWGFLNALRDGARPEVSLVLVLFITAVLLGQEGGSPQVLKLEGDVQYTHDPSIAKDGDTWYLLSPLSDISEKLYCREKCTSSTYDLSR